MKQKYFFFKRHKIGQNIHQGKIDGIDKYFRISEVGVLQGQEVLVREVLVKKENSLN